METIAVVMTTCARQGWVGDLRASYAEQTIAALKNLRYDGPMRLHFADDGSKPGYVGQLLRWGQRVQDWTAVSSTNVHGKGVGKSINEALEFLDSDLVFYIQDDCELIGELDLTIPVGILDAEPGIGMVRTGLVHPNLHAVSQYGGPRLQYYWLIDKVASGFSFTYRSWLAHRRFFDAYGPQPEGMDLYNTERVYNERVRATPGPDIAYAGNIQLNHPWRYIGEVSVDAEAAP